MLKNYLKIAFRNIIKSRGFSLINISGLAIGIACAVIIFLWVDNQLSFDKAQENKHNIYRVEGVDWVDMPAIVGTLLSELPEIKQVVRFNSWEIPTLKYKDYLANIKDFVFADKGVFKVFTLPFTRGNPDTALHNPFSLVISESLAAAIFGKENPIGQKVKYNDTFYFTVTGVIKDVDKFHVKINALASFESLPEIRGDKNFLRGYNWNYPTYLLLAESTDIPTTAERINKFLVKNSHLEKGKFILRPFTGIYFARDLKYEKGCIHGNTQLVILFSVIAVLILFIACINFINLTIARSSTRMKEISIRKVVGAAQKNLAGQFLGEILLLVLIALTIALFLIEAFLPAFNNLTGDSLDFHYFDPKFISFILIIFLFTGITAGLYPSFYLSSFRPSVLLKGKGNKSTDRSSLRKVLVVCQYSISIFLIIGTFTVFRQINFMKNMDLGFNMEQILNINLKGDLKNQKKMLFRELLLQNPDILKVSFSNQVPGSLTNTNTWKVNGEDKAMTVLNTDPDYITLMDVELKEGRDLSWNKRTDMATKLILNEEAVKYLGMESPLGKTVRANFGQSEIIGVVKDYHFNSLHNKIGPLAICWYPRWANVANIKIAGGNIGRSITHIRKVWSELAPGFPFNYSFLDESFGQQYRAENRMAEILKYFAFLAIFLANLGLFGLATFTAEQKTKEIGIRKVLGSSLTGIATLLSKQFMKWVLLANIIAWPLAYFAMNKWLQNFAYRISPGIFIFILSGLLALTIAMITVSYQSIKAALTNPVDALKYE